jgi:hypothetical protein
MTIRIKEFTPEGVNPTLYSLFLISLGTPIIITVFYNIA